MRTPRPAVGNNRREHSDGVGSPGERSDTSSDFNAAFETIKTLNRGASGFVHLARDRRTGIVYAIKYILRGENFNGRSISRELMNQKMCSGHPNVVKLHEVFLTRKYLGIVMEYADGGDLSQFIDQQTSQGVYGLSEDDGRWLFQQLIVALDMIHQLGIAHRDVKLDNLMLHGCWPSPILKICDFGFSTDEAGQSMPSSTCGTPEYMAPEVLFESRYEGSAADLWSCGVSLYVMLAGIFPFSRDEDEDFANDVRVKRRFRQLIQGGYVPLTWTSPQCQDLMSQLLQSDPAKRINMAQIKCHPWFLEKVPALLLTLNARIMAASAYNAGISGVHSSEEMFNLINNGSSTSLSQTCTSSPAECAHSDSATSLHTNRTGQAIIS